MNPLLLLLVVFVLVPVAEIALLLQAGEQIGVWPTVGLVILTAVLGGALVRRQGMATLQRVREHLDRGQLPATELLEGVVLLVAGALLLTPGFVTDTLGFICLVAPLRRYLIQSWLWPAVLGGQTAARGDSQVLEGEFSVETDAEFIVDKKNE